MEDEKRKGIGSLCKISTLPTTFGPITKDIATPREPHNADIAVAVVLSFRGNHAEDNNGGAACVTGPARPFKSCPVVIVLHKMDIINIRNVQDEVFAKR